MPAYQFEYDPMDPNASGGLTRTTGTLPYYLSNYSGAIDAAKDIYGSYGSLSDFGNSYKNVFRNTSGILNTSRSLANPMDVYKNSMGISDVVQSKIDPTGKIGKTLGFQKNGNLLDPSGITGGLLKSNASKKWYRDYRKWADYWRTGMTEAMGYGKGQATDPLAQLQTALMGKVDMNQIQNGYSQNYDPSGLVSAQNKAMANTLNQRAAGMGVGGAYDAVLNASNASRQTLINQAMAAYRPQAYEAQQQLTQNSDQLLQAIQQANIEAQKSLAGAGRSYG